jgi:hypothetical protein
VLGGGTEDMDGLVIYNVAGTRSVLVRMESYRRGESSGD